MKCDSKKSIKLRGPKMKWKKYLNVDQREKSYKGDTNFIIWQNQELLHSIVLEILSIGSENITLYHLK